MLLNALRERTRIYHDQLESSVEVMSPGLTPGRYLALLKSFYGFYLPVESSLQARGEWNHLDIDFSRRTKIPRMHQDFASLGLDEAQIAKIPLCPVSALPPLVSFDDALGCAYVLEGATLGGQVISRHLHGLFDMDSTSGCAFFGSYGSEVGPMWKSFVAALNSYPTTAEQSERIIVSACRTFESFHHWLAQKAS